MIEELLLCPFCGGSVTLEKTRDGRDWFGVVCRNTTNVGGTCAIEQRPSASKEAAIERWNRRVEARDGEAIPQGWKLVPLEPSNKMTAVGQEHRYESVWSIGAIYREMIAHAPIPPTDSVDAARYRWLAERYTGFDFDWMPDNDGTGGKSVLCFQIDANFPVGIGRDVSVYIDAAIASLTKTADGEKDA